MEEFENKLVELFNETALPMEAKRYVVLTFYRNVEDAYRAEKLKKGEHSNEQMSQ